MQRTQTDIFGVMSSDADELIEWHGGGKRDGRGVTDSETERVVRDMQRGKGWTYDSTWLKS